MIMDFLRKFTVVESLVFPQDTSEEEMKEKLVDLNTQSMIVLDKTTERNLPEQYLHPNGEIKDEFEAGHCLDYSFERVMNDFFYLKWKMSSSDMLTTLLKHPMIEWLAKKDIVIVKERLNEHASCEVDNDKLAEAVKGVCKSIYPESNVTIVSSEMDAVALTLDNNFFGTFIFDRHCTKLGRLVDSMAGYNEDRKKVREKDETFFRWKNFILFPLSDFPVYLKKQDLWLTPELLLDYEEYIDLLSWEVACHVLRDLFDRPKTLRGDKVEFKMPGN